MVFDKVFERGSENNSWTEKDASEFIEEVEAVRDSEDESIKSLRITFPEELDEAMELYRTSVLHRSFVDRELQAHQKAVDITQQTGRYAVKGFMFELLGETFELDDEYMNSL